MGSTDVDVAFVDIEFGIGVEQHEHGGEFEGRPGLDAHAQCEVVAFVTLVGFLVALQIGNGFHFAGGHFHDDGAALFGDVVDDGVAQGALSDVLDADVDGGDDVVAVDGLDVVRVFDGNPCAMVKVALPMPAVAAAEDGVARAFQSDEFVVVDIAYGAFGEGAVGVVALELGLRHAEAAFEVAFLEDGEGPHLLALAQCDVEVDEEIFLAFGLGVDEAFLPGGGAFAWEHGRQLLAELVDAGVEGGVVDDRGVDADLEDGYIGGQHAAVAGEDIAP